MAPLSPRGATPVNRLALRASTEPEVRTALTFPGVRWRYSRTGWRGESGHYWADVPYHTEPAVLARAAALGARLGRLTAPWEPPSADEVLAVAGPRVLARQELRPGVWEQALLPFQRRVIGELLRFGSLHVWADPGGGKTLISLAGALALTPAVAPIVVVTRGGARLSWREEAIRWSVVEPFVLWPESKRRIKDGNLRDYLRPRRLREPGGPRWVARSLLIVGWESLPDWVYAENGRPEGFLPRILAEHPASTLILDEAHYGKSHKRADWGVDEEGNLSGTDNGSVTAAAHHLARVAGHRIATTATPVANALSDIWAQLDLVHPGTWGGFWSFARTYCGAHQGTYAMVADAEPPPGAKGYGWLPHSTELRSRLRLAAVRVAYEESHGQLPAKRRVVERIPADRQGRALGGDKRERMAAAKAGLADRFTELLLGEAAERARPRAKEVIAEWLQVRDGHGKIVVMAGLRVAAAAMVAEDAAKLVAKYEGGVCWFRVGENSSERERFETARAFYDHPGPCVLVTTQASMGESINGLQAADLLLWVQLPQTPRQIQQGEGRATRIGQKGGVEIRYLIPEGTYAEVVAEKLLAKLPGVELVLDSNDMRGFATELGGTGSEEEIMAGLLVAVQTAMDRAIRTRSRKGSSTQEGDDDATADAD